MERVDEVVMTSNYVREVPTSNLGRVTNCPEVLRVIGSVSTSE
jgi:hypothetical protein